MKNRKFLVVALCFLTASAFAIELNPKGLKFAQWLFFEDQSVAVLGGETLTPKNEALKNFNLSQAVTSSVLSKDYDDNEVAADIKYKPKEGSKYLLVTGGILGINKDFKGDPYVNLSGHQDFFNVQAQFDKKSIESLSGLKKGQKENFVCRESSKIVTNVILRNCILYHDYSKNIRPKIDNYVMNVLEGKQEVSMEIAEKMATVYVIGKYLPENSPCFTSGLENRGCINELKKIRKKSSNEFKDEIKAVHKELKVRK